jgi:NTP pyrophosphatase (non-canonical NTP hydrolase)
MRLCDINELADRIHTVNKEKGFWANDRNVGEMLMLVTSELGEALEAHRKNKKDDHLPQYEGLHVEIADAIIRLLDMSAGLGININKIILDKLEYNKSRPRLHGKAY